LRGVDAEGLAVAVGDLEAELPTGKDKPDAGTGDGENGDEAIATFAVARYGHHVVVFLLPGTVPTQRGAGFFSGQAGTASTDCAASSVVDGRRPRVGSERSQRCNSPTSITNDLPCLRALSSPFLMAEKILVLRKPVHSAASSGVRASRGCLVGASSIEVMDRHLFAVKTKQQVRI